MNSMQRQKDMMLEDKPPRSESVFCFHFHFLNVEFQANFSTLVFHFH